jgi:uncharacterized protein (TIGR03083 family)
LWRAPLGDVSSQRGAHIKGVSSSSTDSQGVFVTDSDRFVETLVREGTALGRAISVGAHRPVAAYRGWTVLDLVAHTGSVHRWVAGLVSSGAEQPPPRPAQLERDPRRLADWFAIGLDDVVGALTQSESSRRVWTMAADQTVGFWRRRMAHETTTHRWDAEHALGTAQPIDAQVAITGLPETLEIHVVRPLAGVRTGGRGERIRLHCTDLPGDWTITLRADGVEVETQARPSDATVAGPASSIWLDLQGRPAPSLERIGDARSVELLYRVLRLVAPPSH